MSIPMQVTPGSLGDGFCPASEQLRFNAYAAALSVTFPLGLGNFSQGNTTPATDMQSFPWFRYNSDGSPDKWYIYFNGAWVSPNPVPANDPAALRFFQGTYASIATYDGGDTNAPGAASGPMWAVIGQTTGGSTDYGSMGGRMPVGVSADFAQGATGGEINHTLLVTEMPAHAHPPPVTATAGYCIDGAPGGNAALNAGNLVNEYQMTGIAGGNADGTTAPHQNMPPFLSAYFIYRTSRIFYVA